MLVGRGIADITGEPADCGMLGYGRAEQRTTGIHLRQRARAFIFGAELPEGGGVRELLLIVAEIPLPMQSVTDAVLRRLAATFGERFTALNTMLTATHTHSGPGGYCGHFLYNATTQGFRPKTFDAIVDGIVEAVLRAQDDVAPAAVSIAHGELRNASTNRSRVSFERNPQADKDFFPDGIDPQTSLVRIERDGRAVGAINFFPTHGTCMTNRNTLISSDSKGFAAYHWERELHGADYLAGEPPEFIAAFAQTNSGDMSPNLRFDGSRRRGAQRFGPTDDEFADTRLIGGRQFEAAAGLFDADGEPIGSGVDARLIYVDLGDVAVRAEFCPDGRPHHTGSPMFSAAMIAGTDEGEGFPTFRQGRNNPLWDSLSRGYYLVNPRLRDAHAPKGIVAPAGMFDRFAEFVQERVPVQLFRIGHLYLIGIPAEVTIVAGLRIRRAVAGIVGAEIRDVLVVGYSNAYVHYVTTPEEYLEQRYEGGSTLFGRWEQPALAQIAAGLATAMRDGMPVVAGTAPELKRQRSRVPRPDADADGYGRVLTDPQRAYATGQAVRADFASAYPNNDLRRGGTYLEVQRRTAAGWVRVADDGDWSTKFRWRRLAKGASVAEIEWTVEAGTEPAEYRIVHFGAARARHGEIVQFDAKTRTFAVG